MGRRLWMAMALAGVASFNIAAANPESLPVRGARFVESGGRLRMYIELDDLLAKRDRDAIADLKSGFVTRFVYRFDVFRWHRGERQELAKIVRESTVHYDPWRETFVVQQLVAGETLHKSTIAEIEDVRIWATVLDVDLGPLAQFERGAKHHYFVRVLAMRNPRDVANETRRRRPRRSRANDGHELSVFARWVSLFVRAAPRADAEVEFRSGGFYLRKPGEAHRSRAERRRKRKEQRR